VDKNKYIILIVDDESSIVNSLTRLLRREGFDSISAANGPEGLEFLEKSEKPVALIISDQRMPDMTGDQFLEKAKVLAPKAMRFLLTGYADMDALIAALNRGQVHRYISKPWNDEDLVMQVGQAVEHFKMVQENEALAELTRRQNEELTHLNRQLEKKVTERSRILLKTHEDLKTTLMDGFRLIISVVEMLNPALGEYLIHVGELCRKVAREMGLEKESVYQIELAGMFHDIGLIGMPESMLIKDKRDMDADEYQLYIQHPLIIAVCFESVPQLAEIGEIIMSHHENYDGSGYPHGLAQNAIPIGGRILAAVSDYCRIIDTWPTDLAEIRQKVIKRYGNELADELKETDSEALLQEVATAVLAQGVGSHYDSAVIEALERALTNLQSAAIKPTLLDINALPEGMILAESVLLKDGKSIMSKGIRLSARLIESLHKLREHNRINSKVLVQIPQKLGP